MGFCPLGTWGSDLDFRLEHGGDGVDRATSGALDHSVGIGHDRHAQSARYHKSSVVRQILLGVDSAAFTRTDSAHRSFLVLCEVRPDSVGWSYGHGLCFWEIIASA